MQIAGARFQNFYSVSGWGRGRLIIFTAGHADVLGPGTTL